MKSDKSVQIALGGVFSAICLLLMFMSSMIPFSSFAMPMLAGLTLAAVVIENGEKTALLVYISISLLSLFIVPDLDAKLMFIAFFGYYPIIRPRIDRIKSKSSRILVKLAVFNTAMILGYYFSLKLFGMEQLVQDNEFLGEYAPPVILLMLNFAFLMYDYLLSKVVYLYVKQFRTIFLGKGK